MKKLFPILSIALLSGVLATQAMAQGTTPAKQQPVSKQSTTKPVVKPVVSNVKKQDADTVKKGQTGAKHTRRHHRKHMVMKHDSTSTKKPVKKSAEK